MDFYGYFALFGIFVLLYVNIATIRIFGGRYGGFPNPIAVLNLVATGCLTYYFVHREGY